jgi:hypothetical protein
MALAVISQPLTAEARVHVLVSPCETYSGQSGNGTGFIPLSSAFLSVSFHQGSILINHLKDEQLAHW